MKRVISEEDYLKLKEAMESLAEQFELCLDLWGEIEEEINDDFLNSLSDDEIVSSRNSGIDDKVELIIKGQKLGAMIIKVESGKVKLKFEKPNTKLSTWYSDEQLQKWQARFSEEVVSSKNVEKGDEIEIEIDGKKFEAVVTGVKTLSVKLKFEDSQLEGQLDDWYSDDLLIEYKAHFLYEEGKILEKIDVIPEEDEIPF